MTTTTPGSTEPTPRFGLRTDELSCVLDDPRFDRATRLLRLQGWRGDDLDAAVDAGPAHRLAPTTCAAVALIGAGTGSVPLLLMAAATAVIGVFAPNHPIELVHNFVARRVGRTPIPANRAGKRLSCFLGSFFLGGAALAFALDLMLVGRILAGAMGGLAIFVALSNICVTSVVYILVWGADGASARRLFPLGRS
ncbi:MAG: DUF4395 domain-containing protein [Actinomycetia bacterium]|nr:DUF4395 domain-containing protein [Actinomycetes bacterium]